MLRFGLCGYQALVRSVEANALNMHLDLDPDLGSAEGELEFGFDLD